MANKCKTCGHSKRAEIEADLLNSVPFRSISEKFGISHTSIRRHFENGHISETLVRATEVRQIADSDDLLKKLRFLQHQSLEILMEARYPTDDYPPSLNTALNAISKAAGLLKIQAELAGKLSDMEVNIAVNLHWQQIKQELFAILKPFPGAQRALSDAAEKGNLSKLEQDMIEPEPGNYEERLSPAVKAICDSMMNFDREPEQHPELLPSEICEKEVKEKPPQLKGLQPTRR